MVTNILLSIIIVLLIARVVLQAWQGRKAMEKGYASTFDVRKAVVCSDNVEDLWRILCQERTYHDYELVSVVKDGDMFYAFLEHKMVKQYYD